MLAEVVANRRKELGMSQRQLAGLAGCSNSTISRIEDPESGLIPDTRTLQNLAKALQLHETELLCGEEASLKLSSAEKHLLAEGLLALITKEEAVQTLTTSENVREASKGHVEELRMLLEKLTKAESEVLT